MRHRLLNGRRLSLEVIVCRVWTVGGTRVLEAARQSKSVVVTVELLHHSALLLFVPDQTGF